MSWHVELVVQRWCGVAARHHTRQVTDVRGERVTVYVLLLRPASVGGARQTSYFLRDGRVGGKGEPNHYVDTVRRELLDIGIAIKISSGDAAHSRAADRRTAVGCGYAIEARPVPESFSIMFIPVIPCLTSDQTLHFSNSHCPLFFGAGMLVDEKNKKNVSDRLLGPPSPVEPWREGKQ